MPDELISIPTADGDMPGQLWRPESGKGPGILRRNVTFETYEGGADHAFDHPDFPMHHPEASKLAWERTVTFLGGRLPPG